MTDEPMSIYRERAHLVAFLAAVYPSEIRRDPADPDWPMVYVRSPEGGLGWHISPDDMDLFGHLDVATHNEWDEHTTEQKYGRLRALTGLVTTVGPVVALPPLAIAKCPHAGPDGKMCARCTLATAAGYDW